MKRSAWFFLFVVWTVGAFAQSARFDSLRMVLPAVSGEQRLAVLFELANGLEGVRPQEGNAYGREGLTLALELGDSASAATLLSSLSYSSSELGNFLDALNFGYRSLEISTAINDPKRIASANSTLGIAYVYMGRYSKALKHHLEALRLRQQLGLTVPTANTLNNIGIAYHNIGQYATAIEYYRRGLVTQGDSIKLPTKARYLTNIGFSFFKMGALDSARTYFDEALKLVAGAPYGVAQAYLYYTLGLLFVELNDLPSALGYLQMSLENYTNLGQKHGRVQLFNALASLHLRTKRYALAMQHADSAVRIAKELVVPDQLVTGYETLHRIYKETGPLAKEYQYYRLYSAAKDSMNILSESKQLAEIAFDHEMQEQQRTIELLKKENKIAELNVSREETQRIILFGGFLISFIFIVVLVVANKRISKKNELIARQNSELSTLNAELESKISEVHLLTGFLPICANCKKIKDDEGNWEQMEKYISKRSDATFSHGICPDCMKSLYGDVLKRYQS